MMINQITLITSSLDTTRRINLSLEFNLKYFKQKFNEKKKNEKKLQGVDVDNGESCRHWENPREL